MIDVERFFEEQLARWPEAAARYEALREVKYRELELDARR